jgi:hypothetical protein
MFCSTSRETRFRLRLRCLWKLLRTTVILGVGPTEQQVTNVRVQMRFHPRAVMRDNSYVGRIMLAVECFRTDKSGVAEDISLIAMSGPFIYKAIRGNTVCRLSGKKRGSTQDMPHLMA